MSRIVSDKNIRLGKPVIEKTRAPVAVILGKLAAGMTYEDVMQEYDITRDDILEALKYAHRLVERQRRSHQ